MLKSFKLEIFFSNTIKMNKNFVKNVSSDTREFKNGPTIKRLTFMI